ncbi:MAG: hypothetical protein RI967_1279 [Planctomycetota bacterium]|jgi:hypothetical protein
MPQNADTPSRDELRELATLEVVGCLDEVESARLERLFEAARPSVQAEIRALQEQLAVEPSLRSSEAVPAELRLRVLARLATAIEEAERAQAPLASIGRTRARDTARDAADERAMASSVDEVLRRVEETQVEATRRSIAAQRTGWWTRAAILFLLASLAVSLFFNWRYTRLSEKVLGFANAAIIDADMRALVATMGAFDFGAAKHVDLRPAIAGVRGHVQVFADASTGRIAILGVGLSAGETLEIVAFGADGETPVVHAFRVETTAFGKLIEVPAAFAANPRIAIRDSWGTVLFSA